MKIKLIFIFFVFSLAFTTAAFSQTRQVIVKLKVEVSSDVYNNFVNENPRAGNSDIARICSQLNVSTSQQLFKKFLPKLNALDNSRGFDLNRIFILNIPEANAGSAITLLSASEEVEYVQFNNRLKLESSAFTPDDAYYSQQYAPQKIGMQNVWNTTRGDSNILIGVVDSGLDFLHEDLQTSFKINPGETGLDAQGRDKRFNGIDDENNGFIDDWRGWDFVDAPFTGDPRRGDYLNPDNDPTDDNSFSHGTGVTGVINATFNNGLGIASIAPDCKVLVLRAFDALGQGEEDDAASAVLYGLIQGVRVFNFSFGDYVFSNLLRDVVKFAYQNNAVIIASAGNDYGYSLHYPSAYDEVISVAASDENDFKASFSSYGQTVDIYAPGFQILTTTRTGKGNAEYGTNYTKQNGTSFAAPQVAGIAALLLSLNGNLTNEEVRGLLVSTTVYMTGQTSWSDKFASGRVNPVNAINNINLPSIARIYNPSQDYTFYNSNIPICISAASPIFNSYTLYYGVGELPDSWIPLQSNIPNQILNDTVYNWNTSSLNDTSYTLRLAINSVPGRTIEHRMIIFKDSAAPVISNLEFGQLLDKNNYSQLIIFATDKRSVGKIYYRPLNSQQPFKEILADLGTPNTGFVANTHFVILQGNSLEQNTNYEFYIEATSLNGKKSLLSGPDFVFNSGSNVNVYGYDKKNYSLPFMQSCQKIVDINNNGKPDVFTNQIKNNLLLNVYEFSDGNFVKISDNNWGDFQVARDLADIDGDGRYELLTSKSRSGRVYKASGKSSLPTNIIWADTTRENFWSARFADTDNDGKIEILGFGYTDLRILEYNNGAFTQIDSLAFTGSGDPEGSSQNVLVEDFNGNGKKEIVFANTFDFSGSIIPDVAVNVYENTTDNHYQKIFTDSLIRVLENDNIFSGDFDGDGIKEFAVGTGSKDDDLIQYYRLIVYKAHPVKGYSVMAIQDIYNYRDYTETSTRAANIDSDNKDEILINTGTQFYVLKYNATTQGFDPLLYMPDINTFNQIIYDFDNDGVKDIGLNTINDTLLFYQKNTTFAGPSTPLNLRGHSIDSNDVSITFDAVTGADYYKIYRSGNDTNFTLIDSVLTTVFSDNNVANKTYFYYKVSAIDASLPVRESKLTNSIPVYVHNKSRLLSASYEGSGFVLLKFSEQVVNTIPDFNKFILQDTALLPASVSVNNPFQYLLKYNGLRQGFHNISTKELFDFYGSPVAENSASFIANDSVANEFYIQNASLLNNRIKVEFNFIVDSSTAMNTNNYKLTPFNIAVTSINIDASNRKVIYVNLGNGTIGATGKNYVLKVSDVFSSDGIKITGGPGSTFGFIFNRQNLEEVYVYPNPFKMGSTAQVLTFANLTVKAKIEIFDLTGRYIKTVEESDGNGGVEWDLKDNSGKEVSSGIYLFRATGINSDNVEVKEKIGKFAVIK